MQDVTVVIRSVGERTQSWCQRICADDTGDENVALVRDVHPFSEALRQSYLIGIDRGRKWTLCIDADVLLAKGAIRKLVAIAHKTHDKLFDVNVRLLDKFFGLPRFVGVKLYRTDYLGEALELVPMAGDQKKPETHTIKQMRKKGFRSVFVKLTAGTHDYFQYVRDIYRKGYTHGLKHIQFIELLVGHWQEKATIDADFRVLLFGFQQARTHPERLQVDIREVPAGLEPFLEHNDIEEKPPLELSGETSTSIFELSQSYHRNQYATVLRSRLEDAMPKNSLPLYYRLRHFLRFGHIL
ncbi:MAG: hypothetical protein JRI70_10675 [Deltaproteobacteria bacterium]|nr:hypothetical protein [Deltaproteobacteria bacterium]